MTLVLGPWNPMRALAIGPQKRRSIYGKKTFRVWSTAVTLRLEWFACLCHLKCSGRDGTTVMWQYVAKVAVTAFVVVAVAELGKRSSFWGALLASLPLTSLLAFAWVVLGQRKHPSRGEAVHQHLLACAAFAIAFSRASPVAAVWLVVLAKLGYRLHRHHRGGTSSSSPSWVAFMCDCSVGAKYVAAAAMRNPSIAINAEERPEASQTSVTRYWRLIAT